MGFVVMPESGGVPVACLAMRLPGRRRAYAGGMAEPHPEVVDRQHPLMVRVREICLAYPDAVEVSAWGRSTYRTPARRSSSSPGRRWRSRSRSSSSPTPTTSRRCARTRGYSRRRTGARSGWLGVRLDPDSDWDELAELVDASYRLVALKRQVAALDAARRVRRPRRADTLDRLFAPVAQRIEHLTTDQKVGGSNPSGRTEKALIRAPCVPAPPTETPQIGGARGSCLVSWLQSRAHRTQTDRGAEFDRARVRKPLLSNCRLRIRNPCHAPNAYGSVLRNVIKSEMVATGTFSRSPNVSSPGSRSISPSAPTISAIAATGRRPASRRRSTAASVWPARERTPPGSARSGRMCPGRRRLLGTDSLPASTRRVWALSVALMPVVAKI